MSTQIFLQTRNTGLVFALLTSLPAYVHAGCGASFCPLNTQWDVQGAWTEPGTRLDFRFEYIDQDQLRSGSDEVSVGEIPQHHDEIRTINRNALLTLDHAFSDAWSLSATLPLVDRSHDHVHNHHGAQLHDRWTFSKTGDLRLLGSYRPQGGNAGLLFGAKLPTGETDVTNDEGNAAERMFQPGSGTTDILLGGFYQNRASATVSWFTQLLWQNALSESDAYKPGRHLSLDTGLRYYSGSSLGWMLQLNVMHEDSDDGAEAEPENSGGLFVFLSPGLSIEAGDALQLYAFLQQSLYQDVEGVQLTAEQSLAIGLSSRF